jgi:hypothetical protein
MSCRRSSIWWCSIAPSHHSPFLRQFLSGIGCATIGWTGDVDEGAVPVVWSRPDRLGATAGASDALAYRDEIAWVGKAYSARPVVPRS